MTRGDADAPPVWLHCKKSLIPDMVAVDPKRMPVWEITGAEFSRSDHHTADGISIRFPRITKQRDDKSHREATTLADLIRLFDASKEGANLHMLTAGLADSDEADRVDIEIKTKIQGVSPPGKREKELVKKAKVETAVRAELADKVGAEPMKTEPAEEIMSPVTRRSVKINYKFEDSSDEDDGMKNETIAPPTKELAVTTNTAVAQIETTTESKVAPAKNPPLTRKRTIEPPPTASTKAKKPTPPRGDTRSNNNNNAAKVTLQIFDGVELFVSDELRERVKEELRYFQLWGGKEATSSRQCSHVLHAEPQMTEDFSVARLGIFQMVEILSTFTLNVINVFL